MLPMQDFAGISFLFVVLDRLYIGFMAINRVTDLQ